MPRSVNWPRARRSAARMLRLPAVLRGVFAVYAEAHGSGTTPAAESGQISGRLHRARLKARFLGTLVAAAPQGLRWLVQGDVQARGALRQAMGLGRLLPAPLMDPAQLAPCENLCWRPPVALILPVFNARDLLAQCLDRIEAHTDLDWHLFVVEDASTDEMLRPWLRGRLAAMAPRATLIEQEANRGFVDSANRGLAAALAATGPSARGAPCILINSDALVPPGWASRLVAPLQDPGVASVTPLSNAAALMSVPVIGVDAPADLATAAAVDTALSRLDPAQAVAAMPAGVGFCMALSRDWLARVPGFDPVFGRGYGEEVDWCRRTASMGARHLLSGAVMVAHVGGESFGVAERVQQLAAGSAILSRRYPDFDAEVQHALARDPAALLRLAAGLALADAAAGPEGEVPVYVAHALGGGAEHWLRDQVAASPFAVILRLGGPSRCQFELSTPWGETRGRTDDLDLVSRLLDFAPRKRVILSSLAGDPDPVGGLAWLGALAGPDLRLEAVVHDHHPISPSFTLLDSTGAYRGLPSPDGKDPAHLFRRPDGTILALRDWQAAWGRFLACCDRITCFSADSRDKLVAVYPDVAARLEILPHPAPPRRPLVPPPGPGIVLGIPGNILGHKGAAVVADLARARVPGLRLVIVGTLDPAAGTVGGVTVTGRYLPAQLPDLARRQGITHWLIPSIWPETYSLTTHEALATGLPVLALDLGAQGAAVRAAPNGIPVPHVAGGNHAAAILRVLMQGSAARGGPAG